MDDITEILNTWRYSPNDINVRIIDGQDGKPKLQMRLDLGLLQMELDGRPDGQRPHRFETYLSYYIHKSRRKRLGKKVPFQLTPVDCWLLQQESIQFYHRYLALMRLGDYDRVIRDTTRNLQVFDFVARHAGDEEIIWSFEQYRPYVVMMNTRALTSQCMENKEYDQALDYIRNAKRLLRRHYRRHQDKIGDDQLELELLQEWAVEVKKKRPLSKRARLQRELTIAIRKEEYERAAVLRDLLGTAGE